MPLLALFLGLYLANPVTKLAYWLPWFQHARVFCRGNMVFSVVFALLAISVDLRRFGPALRTMVIGALGVTFAAEVYTIGWIKMRAAAPAVTANMSGYMAKIAQAPGEALLDFPSASSAATATSATCAPSTRATACTRCSASTTRR